MENMELADRAKQIVDDHFAGREELREKLNALGVTRRHLTELFEKKYDLTLEQYAAQVRLRRAKELLDGGSRITDAAFAVGMESSASFSTFFKKLEGITPSEYAAQRASERPCRFCETPLGPVRMAEDERGISSLKFVDSAPGPMRAGQKGLYLADAEKQISEYFAGKRRTFDIPLSIRGSEFQETVWNALRTIPYGETRSYQQVAQMIGSGKASRAVGMANNRNPILIMIPCHRVVGKDGKLVGYAGGIERKERLLELEREAEK